MDRQDLINFVEKHTDEQCGLDVANVTVDFIHLRISIIVSAKKVKETKERKVKSGRMKGMKEEWREQANDLILELSRDPRAGYGGFDLEFEIYHITDTFFELREKEK